MPRQISPALSVTLIPRSGKRRALSHQTTRDNSRLIERMRRCSEMLKLVEPVLKGPYGKRTMSELLSLADGCTRVDPGLPPADRLARRSRPGLLCWFCENWGAVAPSILVLHEMATRRTAPAPAAPKAGDPAREQIHPLSVAALMNR
jgi:hypothetical protein